MSGVSQNASDPIHAWLNYFYASLETAVRSSILTIVLDPGVVIRHSDLSHRDSFVHGGIFADKAGADESTARAITFGQQGTHDWVEGDPIIIEGAMDTAAP